MASLDQEMAKNVLRQVEFYLSDSNLPRDNFLKRNVDESEDGLVSLAMVCSFSRMRKHIRCPEPEIIKDETVQAVAKVLRDSTSLKISEDGTRVGRLKELLKPEEAIEQMDSRTVAASPLRCDVTREEVEAFFTQHGKVNSVRLPNIVGDKRHFCGTALIEFSEVDDAEKVLKSSLVFDGAELKIKPKKDFDSERQKKLKEVEKNRFNKDASNGYPKGLIISFKLKSTQSEGSTEQTDAEVSKTEEVPNSSEHASESEQNNLEKDVKDEKPSIVVKQENEEKAVPSEGEQKTSENYDRDVNPSDIVKKEIEEKATVANEGEQKTLEKNTEEDEKPSNIVKEEIEEKATENHIKTEETTDNNSQESKDKVSKNVSFPSDDKNIVTREDLRHVFQKFGTVKYIDFSMGKDSGYIRFEDPDAAVKARAMAVLADQGGLVVKNFIATLEALTGDAEKEYWSSLRGHQWETKNNNRGRGGRHNRGGGRHFDGKRSRQSDSAGGRPNKAQKVGGDA